MSGALIAINIPLHINIANNIKTAVQPTKPSSSPNIENIKSLCGSGIYKNFCLLSPKPAPNNPPEPIAYKLCITCQPSPVASFHGSKNVTTLCSLYSENIISAITPWNSYCPTSSQKMPKFTSSHYHHNTTNSNNNY